MALLEAREVTVRFGGLVAVDAVSLAVDEGETVGLIGPNGAGKTTLLGAVGGQVIPHEGRVRFGGHDVTDWEPERRAMAGIGRTFQRLELFRKLTVFENLLVAAEARFGEAAFIVDLAGRTRRGQAEALAREVAARLGIEAVLDRLADHVPTGLGRLVEIGRALCTGPRLLLLDEPAGGLDEAETQRLADVLREVGGPEGPAVLLVEHDLRVVMDLCQRIAVMDFGRLIAEGSPAEVRDDPAVQAAYLGEVVDAGTARGA
ncbi:MAG TPA: ABC transporter ATP-binding protein [Actinomycetota bacterium]|nr:ABC transporter ATP-binding protein [Actinomycetota bacterium]